MEIVINAVSMPNLCQRILRLLLMECLLSSNIELVTSYWSFESMQSFKQGKHFKISLPHKTPNKVLKSSNTEFGHQEFIQESMADYQPEIFRLTKSNRIFKKLLTAVDKSSLRIN